MHNSHSLKNGMDLWMSFKMSSFNIIYDSYETYPVSWIYSHRVIRELAPFSWRYCLKKQCFLFWNMHIYNWYIWSSSQVHIQIILTLYINFLPKYPHLWFTENIKHTLIGVLSHKRLSHHTYHLLVIQPVDSVSRSVRHSTCWLAHVIGNAITKKHVNGHNYSLYVDRMYRISEIALWCHSISLCLYRDLAFRQSQSIHLCHV